MTHHRDYTNLDEVMVPEETAIPDHKEHAKAPKHLNEDELDRRTEHEREAVRAESQDAPSHGSPVAAQ